MKVKLNSLEHCSLHRQGVSQEEKWTAFIKGPHFQTWNRSWKCNFNSIPKILVCYFYSIEYILWKHASNKKTWYLIVEKGVTFDNVATTLPSKYKFKENQRKNSIFFPEWLYYIDCWIKSQKFLFDRFDRCWESSPHFCFGQFNTWTGLLIVMQRKANTSFRYSYDIISSTQFHYSNT